jgi:putative PIN family toxin of toxin-antitoxin system
VRVLPDVNVLVRANEKSDGPARRLLLHLVSHKHVIVTSAEILIELVRVLRYPRVQALFGLSEEQIYQYIRFLRSACTVVVVDMTMNFPIRDAADTPILRAAIAGEADFICTLDTDFYTGEVTRLCGTMAISVLDDISLLRRVQSLQ